MADRWVPNLGYSLAKVDGQTLVLRRGLLYVAPYVPDHEVMARPFAIATDYDAGVLIMNALNAALNIGDAGASSATSGEVGQSNG